MKLTTGSRRLLTLAALLLATMLILGCASCTPSYVGLPESRIPIILAPGDQITRDGKVILEIKFWRVAITEGDYMRLLDDAQDNFMKGEE